MKNMINIKSILFSLVVLMAVACNPRVSLDEGQWGDKAYITNVQIFSNEEKNDFHLAEFYENGQNTTGVRRILLDGTKVSIDNEMFTVKITIPEGNDLSNAGFLVSHSSKLVEPVEGSPVCGTLVNLNKEQYKYKLYSADGTTRVWTIVLE